MLEKKESEVAIMLRVRTDVMKILKKAGYNSRRLRRESILSESTMTRLRHGNDICLSTLSKLCDLLDVPYAYLIEEVKDGEEV